MSTVGNWRGPNIVKDGLVLYLDAGSPNSYINGISGTSWKDISGNASNGTLINGSTYNSLDGGAIAFDGLNQYTEIPKTGILSGKNKFTINCWIYPTSLTGIRPIFVNYYVGNLEVLFRTNGSNLQFFTFTNSQIGGTTQAFTSINQWSNVVATYDGSIMKTYVNGVQSGTTFNQSGNLSTSTLPYLVGYYTSPTQYYFSGRVAFVCVYDTALDLTEINQNFNVTRARFGI